VVPNPSFPTSTPNVAEPYRRKVKRLAEALTEDPSSQEAAIALQSLIGEVVLTPGKKRGEVNATPRGELMGILDFANGGNAPGTIVITKGAVGPATIYVGPAGAH
jgi:site-specific DNA recombinase